MNKSLRNVFLSLLLIVFILLGMNFFPATLSWTIADRFNLNGEANVPAWYSTVLLFSVSLVSLAIYLIGRKGIFRDRPWNSFWLWFAGVYCFLSLDEASRLHEIINNATPFEWVYFYAPFAGIFFIACVFYFAIFGDSGRRVRNWVLGGLVAYALGGLVSELIGYLLSPMPPAVKQTEFVIEEGLEMTGAIMVLMGCLQELRRLYAIVIADKNSGG